jgi:hypothetical protein
MEKKKKIIFDLNELEDIGVYAISIVKNPAIEAGFVALSAHDVKLKIDEERRMIYGPVLIPNKEIIRIDEKGEEYFIEFPEPTIRKAQEQFFKQMRQQQHTYEHQFSIDGLTVVESWIKEGPSDKSVQLGMDYPEGTWFVGSKVDNADAWERVKKGEVTGFSIEGKFSEKDAELSREQKAVLAVDLLLKRFDAILGKQVEKYWGVEKSIGWIKENLSIDVTGEKGKLEIPMTNETFLQIEKNAPESVLFDLGLRVWATMNEIIEEENQYGDKRELLEKDKKIWLLPPYMLKFVPKGHELYGLFGEKTTAREGMDDDTRFGVTAYGILKDF